MAQLLRTLRLQDLVMLIVGAVIGSGIFLVPAEILRQTHNSVGVASLVWIAGGLLSILGALTYGELAAMKPETGGLYVYVRDGFGPLAAFLYGWATFIAIASGSIASLAVAFSSYLSAIVPLSPVAEKVVAVAVIAFLTAVNVWGTRKSSDLQNWTTLIKLVMIVGLCAALLFLGRGYYSMAHSLWTEPLSGSLLSRFGIAMIAVLWAYEGWQFATYSAGEVIDPEKNFPRALLASVLFLAGIYLLANLGYLAALGPARAANSETIAAAATSAVLGSSASKVIALIIMISVFSGLNSIPLTAPRIFYAMAKDGIFFHKLAEVHPRFHTPAVAIIALGAWSAVLALMGKFQQLISYAMFVAWIFYGLGAAAIFVYRRKFPDMPRPYRVPGYPWTPLLFVAVAFALVVNVIASSPKSSLLALSFVAAGLPAYLIWSTKRPVTHGSSANSAIAEDVSSQIR